MEIEQAQPIEKMEIDQPIANAPTTSSSYRKKLRIVAIVGLVAVGYVLVSHTSLGRGKDNTRQSIDYSILTNEILERKNRPIRVACVGDSITEKGACIGNNNYTYVSQLSDLLGSDYEVTNHGHSGQTMCKTGMCCRNNETWPCSYWNTPQFKAAIASSPDIVTIMLGTNDAKRCNWYGPPDGNPTGNGHEYVLDYLEMLQVFWSLPSAPKIYIAIPPPLVHPPEHPDRPVPFDMDDHVANDELTVLVPSIAKQFGSKVNTTIGIIDVWSALGGPQGYQDPSMTCDGCHPKKDAFTIIARTFALAITTGHEG